MNHPSPFYRPFSFLRDCRDISAVLDDTERFLSDLRNGTVETETAYVYTIELPGFKKADVGVTVGKLSNSTKGVCVIVCAARNGANAISRSVPLPSDADSTKVEAKLEDGLLVVTVQKLAKPAPPAPRKVTVS